MAGVDRPLARGADFVQACESSQQDARVACLNYFSGVIDVMMELHEEQERNAGYPHGTEPPWICPPANVGDGMEKAALSEFHREPGSLHESATYGIIAGLTTAFPCSAPAPPPPK
ncbi:Rap1a/Tai family immunity protein [Caulobacter sp. S45]|uniref:Rap1a/Tai family immunity protein n=1 Tax=Caulobacter sp. S45 TaxID=1641861 RepID=UPI0035304D31